MKLYTVYIRHCAPKDCKKAIVGYYLSDNENNIMHYIDKHLLGGIWSDREEDSLIEPITSYDEDGNEFTETFFQKMLRLRGEYHDPFADFSDAYYGVTHYGWSEGKELTEFEAQTLLGLGVAVQLK